MDIKLGVLIGVVGLMAAGTFTALGSQRCENSSISGRSNTRASRTEGAGAQEVSFLSARPVWPKGRETEKNLFVGFRAVFNNPRNGRALLRLVPEL